MRVGGPELPTHSYLMGMLFQWPFSPLDLLLRVVSRPFSARFLPLILVIGSDCFSVCVSVNLLPFLLSLPADFLSGALLSSELFHILCLLTRCFRALSSCVSVSRPSLSPVNVNCQCRQCRAQVSAESCSSAGLHI